MARPTDPTDPRIPEMVARLRDAESGWLDLVLENLAASVLQAAQWLVWEENGGVPGPLDSRGSWPRLPDKPGEKVLLGVVAWEDATEELELLAGGADLESDWADPRDRVRALATTLREDLASSSELLGDDFFLKGAQTVLTILDTPRRLPVCLMRGRQNLWRHPSHPLGLPPLDHPVRVSIESEEVLAFDGAAWKAARFLYRRIGQHLRPEASPAGRQGLEHPEVLRDHAVRWRIIEPPDAEPPLLTGRDALDMASSPPVRNGVALMLAPRLEEDDLGAVMRKPSTHHRLAPVGFDRYSSEPAAFAGLQETYAVLQQHGPEMARLCMYLCGLVCTLPDPSRRFWLRGTELLDNLGYSLDNKARGTTRPQLRSELLHRLAAIAFQLERVWAESLNQKAGAVPSGRLWNIDLEPVFPAQMELTLEQVGEAPWAELNLSVVAGSWVSRYRIGGPGDGDGGTWYAPIASRTLKLSRFGNDLALRLGLFLALVGRERALVTAKHPERDGSWTCTLGSLLREVLPAAEIDTALAPGSGNEAHSLRRNLEVALGVLREEVGYRFVFHEDYPLWARPDWATPEGYERGRAPKGALERQLRGHLTIHWPEPVVRRNEQNRRLGEAEVNARRLRAAGRKKGQTPHQLAGDLKVMVDALPIPRNRVAQALGISPSYLSKLLNPGSKNGKSLTEEKLRAFQETLASLKHLRRG